MCVLPDRRFAYGSLVVCVLHGSLVGRGLCVCVCAPDRRFAYGSLVGRCVCVYTRFAYGSLVDRGVCVYSICLWQSGRQGCVLLPI